MQKKWVFSSLVTKDDDVVGLIAYALYKHRKDELARGLRAQGKDEEEISTELVHYHDNMVNQQSQLNDWREKASQIIAAIAKDASNKAIERKNNELENERKGLQDEKNRLANLEARLRAKQNKIPSDIEAGIKKGLSEFVMDAAKHIGKPTIPQKIGSWLIGGFSGYAAGIILVFLAWAYLAGTSDQSIKEQILTGFTKSVTEYVTTNPVPTVADN